MVFVVARRVRGGGGVGGGGNRIGLVCGTHEEDNGTGGGGASVTRFCFVARSTGVCHGCRLASPRLLSDSGGRTGSHENRGPGPFNEGRAVSYQRWTSHHYNHH